jgi:hypothetical protein
MTTMPEVAGGWSRSLLGALGGISGAKLYIWGVAGYDTPIWDVLAPEGEQEEALNRLRTGSISPGFPIRQVVPVGPARARICCWARWARFFIPKKKYIARYNIFTHFIYSGGGENGWMGCDQLG